MSFVVFNNGTNKHLTPEQGLALWEVLQGRVEPTKQQEQWCLNIKRLYLNKYTAPEDYIQRYKLLVTKQVLGDYMCDREGNLTKPDWVRGVALAFAKYHQAEMRQVKQLHQRG